MEKNASIFAKVKEIQKICWDISRQSEEYKNDMMNWERIYFTRKISIWITYFLRNSAISPNQVTALWVLLGIIGGFLLIFNIYWVSIFAFSLLFLSWILDNVDGELARHKKQYSIAGNFLDMIGHEIIFPVVFCCLTFSAVLQSQSNFIVFLGLLATAFATPMNKMQENAKLLLCIKAISQGVKLEISKSQVHPISELKNLRRVAIKIIAIIFSEIGMFYLLFIAIVFKVENFYLCLYGLGLPLLFIPKYLIRTRELIKIAEDPSLLKKLFRPEWMDC
jgi:phosphatidylglycerophosphate synthase